ncbi:MAG: hypothetical protein AAGJ40_02760 [Planctomycetota bacterium]
MTDNEAPENVFDPLATERAGWTAVFTGEVCSAAFRATGWAMRSYLFSDEGLGTDYTGGAIESMLKDPGMWSYDEHGDVFAFRLQMSEINKLDIYLVTE